MSTRTKVIFLIIGAMIGAAVTYKVTKDHYELIEQEYEEGLEEGQPDETEDQIDSCANLSFKQYHKLARMYTDYSGPNPPDGIDEESDVCPPYVIPEALFTEADDRYDQESLIYYAGDETLVNDQNEMVPDPESLVGINLGNFGEDSGDPDRVYVRNERLMTDFEVSRIDIAYGARLKTVRE